ncbi:30S ribosomal protein S14 [Levilactobacillus brevis]|mgnify:CR=1 FL=1|uniref:Small ribosomal subunit protein uS14 n=1 Tax=Levilactobacillus brevis TaxID=1580 RepID=A0AA41ES06_LEVBR|nr:30S ribosomal protein S14 [Levilactobacillus brevis]MBS0948665.1 30S ribosomal protein S14 [Levilactobacillus brevis]MBS1011804.1 30S ribosomal protein S14 [Levilactobacillus brevis]
MAKKSKVVRYERQKKLIAKYAVRRKQLKAQGDYSALSKLPKDSSPVRLRNRDSFDGRPRGYMRKFGMSRLNFRKYALLGQIPGLHKASW